MNYNTIYVGMDVHKESFSLCAYTIEAEKASHYQRTEADYKKVLNYLEFLRTIYGDDANFICGYEAGCLGLTCRYPIHVYQSGQGRELMLRGSFRVPSATIK